VFPTSGFSSLGTLARHRFIHQQEKRYKCSSCRKSFDRRDQYNRHIKVEEKRRARQNARQDSLTKKGSQTEKGHKKLRRRRYKNSNSVGSYSKLTWVPIQAPPLPVSVSCTRSKAPSRRTTEKEEGIQVLSNIPAEEKKIRFRLWTVETRNHPSSNLFKPTGGEGSCIKTASF
jgi:hypothetical protein